ncbi:hypothetical protein [Bacillus mycoides]|nr:hypothetical protein [Bacillus mycoides]
MLKFLYKRDSDQTVTIDIRCNFEAIISVCATPVALFEMLKFFGII